MKKIRFNNLQVNDNDLIGNKFNGHDLHLALRDKSIDSKQLVLRKKSHDKYTFEMGAGREDKWKFRDYIKSIQKEYCLDAAVSNPFGFDIMYSNLFLDADVVHLHLIHNGIFDIQLLPLMSALKPIVWTIHDPWALGGHCIHHFDCSKWMSNCGDCPYLSMPYALQKDNTALNQRIKRNAITNSNIDIVVASNWLKKKIEKSPTFKGKKVHLIPFGIDQDIFSPLNRDKIRNELNIPQNAFVISIRADYSPFKGMDYIESALTKIKTDREIYVLVTAGKLLMNTDNIVVKQFGWINDDQLLAKIYNASDVFLMPSLMETFGMMAIEAMSCGAVPIVLDGTALPETVNSPNCGIATKRNKSDYVKKLQQLIQNDDELKKHSKKCIQYAQKYYSKERYVNSVINVYENVINKHKNTKEDKYLLNQIKKHIQVEVVSSQTASINYDDVNPNSLKAKVLIFAYKCNKYLPKEIRKKIRQLVKKNYK